MTTTSASALASPASSGNRDRHDVLDFLRLLAAVTVVVQHANAEQGENFGGGAFDLIDGVPILPPVGLHGLPVRRADLRADRELAAILLEQVPQHWAGDLRVAIITPLVLVAVGAVAASALGDRQMLVWLGAALFLVPNYDPNLWAHVGTEAMTWPLYTIPAEISFYVAVPVLVLVVRRWGF